MQILYILSFKVRKLTCWYVLQYTEKNLRFALTVEPDNEKISQKLSWAQKQRQENLPTIPSTIGEEFETNPFMRADLPEIQVYIFPCGFWSFWLRGLIFGSVFSCFFNCVDGVGICVLCISFLFLEKGIRCSYVQQLLSDGLIHCLFDLFSSWILTEILAVHQSLWTNLTTFAYFKCIMIIDVELCPRHFHAAYWPPSLPSLPRYS